MELAGRTALLTGATGGLGRAIAGALAARGASLVLSARKPEALRRWRRSFRARHTTCCRPTSRSRAPPRASPRRGEVDILVANAGLPAAGWLTDFTPEQVTRALRVNLEAPMLMARALYPAMVERGTGHLVFISSLVGQGRQPAQPRSTTRPSSACADSPSACAPTLRPKGVGVSLVTPGFIRDAGMFAESGAKPPAGMGTGRPEQVGEAVVKAIERDKVEIAVGPLRQRALSHFALASPGIAVRAQSGSAGQKAAESIAAGHPRRQALERS